MQCHVTSNDDLQPTLHSVAKSVSACYECLRDSMILPHPHSAMHKTLYYTADDETPFVLEQKYIVSNRVFLQRMHVILGMLFTVSLTSPQTPHCPSVWHNLTITRDRRKDYHVYRHASSWRWDLAQPLVNSTDFCVRKQIETKDHLFEKSFHHSATCPTSPEHWSKSIEKWPSESPSGAFESDSLFHAPFYHIASCGWQWCPHTKCQQHLCGGIQMDTLSGCRVVKVATYNVWNLNRLESEEYEDRLGRLGKVLC